MITSLISSLPIGSLTVSILLIVGYFTTFKKCNVNPFWSLLPGIRDYKLAKVAGRTSDAIKYMIFEIIAIICTTIIQFNYELFNSNIDEYAEIFLLLFGMAMLGGVGSFVYTLRIFSGLCDLFHVKKKWLFFVVFVGRFLPLMIWGLREKYVPTLIKEEAQDLDGAALSGIEVDSKGEGLAINIEERVATDNFKKKTLLRDIHLNIDPGHMVLLLGGSGAGKTTFVNAINGYEKAEANIILNGTSIYDEYGSMKYKIGFVPQADLMRGNDTVISTLKDSARLRLPTSMSTEDRNERIQEALDFFGLDPVKNNLVSKLSGGQRKRLSIAMEYISNPDLFILDEPDSGLDGVMARELMEGLRKIADQGKIVIVITHSPDRVIDLFDDVIVLAKDSKLTGRLTFFGPIKAAKEFFEREEMEKIVLRINRKEEGGEGLADSFIEKYTEVYHG